MRCISHDFWQRRFGGRPDVLGQAIALRGGVVSVIGVMPARFFGETVGERPDAWVPLAMQAVAHAGPASGCATSRAAWRR